MAQKTGLGTTLVFGTTSAYTPKKISISGPSISREAHDKSHLGSTGYKEYQPDDLIEGGEVQAECFWDPLDGYPPVGSAAETITITHNDSGSATEAFTGFVAGFDKAIGIGALMTATLTIKVAGTITFTA
jgi:hypothetical protein